MTGALQQDTGLRFPHVLVVDASAGSGKTHTLALRFIQFLLSRRIPRNDLSNILATTFTNNAAREMKQRIIRWLKVLALDLADEDTQQLYALLADPAEVVHMRAHDLVEEVIDRYTDLHVQTIDSFMTRILRSSADELGIPPDNDVTDSYVKLTGEAAEMLFAGFGTSVPREDVDAFLESYNQLPRKGFVWNPAEDIQRQFAQFLHQEGRVLEDIVFGDEREAIALEYQHIVELYEKVTASISAKYLRKHILSGLGPGRVEQADLMEFLGDFDPEQCGIKQYRTGVSFLNTPDGQRIAGELRKHVAELANHLSLAHYAPYRSLYRQFKTHLAAVKRWNETIHFDDINRQLVRYIRQDSVPEIYYRLGDVLYHFLLDEFQDTGRVQWENVKPLLEEAYAKGGTLFAVGDMKQAIYMWRQADYRIMRHVVRCIREKREDVCLPASVRDNASVVALGWNYRSGGVILEYVDWLFKKRIKELPAVLPDDRTGLSAFEQRAKDENQGHGYVKSVVLEESAARPERDAVLGILRDVMRRYALKDVAVLVRANWQVEEVVTWLTAAGIRAASLSSLDIRKRRVIAEIVSLLKFLDAPTDNLSFAQFIGGSVFRAATRGGGGRLDTGAIHDLLMSWRVHDHRGFLYTHFRDHPRFAGAWRDYFEELFNIVGFYPLYDLVVEVYRIFRVVENFPNEAGFLARFLEAVSSMEAQGAGDIKELAGLADEEGEQGLFSILLPDYVDAVKVMTFHKAKGLGFAVVIDLFRAEGGFNENTFFDPASGDLQIRYVNACLRRCDPRLQQLYAERALDERVELLNLYYVALTRAKHELYCVTVCPAKAPGDKPVEESDPIWLFQDHESGVKERPPIEQREHAPTAIVIPKRAIYELPREEDRGWSVARLLETQRGELYHEILAEIEFLEDGIEPTIRETVSRALEVSSRKYEPELMTTILLRFLAVPEVRAWFEKQAGRTVLREVEFVNEAGAVHRMDRVVVDTDRVTLIDFKTGDPLPFYAAQMANYRQILKQVHPGKEIICYFAYIDPCRIEKVP